MEPKGIKEMRKDPIVVSKTREILNRAVIDPQFRKELFDNPKKSIKRFDLRGEEEEIILANLDERMLSFIQSIDDKISLLSEAVLCTNGGPCGIA
jgi:hypothetical protein